MMTAPEGSQLNDGALRFDLINYRLNRAAHYRCSHECYQHHRHHHHHRCRYCNQSVVLIASRHRTSWWRLERSHSSPTGDVQLLLARHTSSTSFCWLWWVCVRLGWSQTSASTNNATKLWSESWPTSSTPSSHNHHGHSLNVELEFSALNLIKSDCDVMRAIICVSTYLSSSRLTPPPHLHASFVEHLFSLLFKWFARMGESFILLRFQWPFQLRWCPLLHPRLRYCYDHWASIALITQSMHVKWKKVVLIIILNY